ncbi:MAG: helicase associated domain-containing protein [Gordonia amarae]
MIPAELHTHIAEYGTADVAAGYIDPDTWFALGAWVADQRITYRDGKLPAEQVAELSALTWWSWMPDACFGRLAHGLSELRRHVAEHGTAAVPSSHKRPVTGYALGNWVRARRRDYRRGTLSPQLAAELEALPGWSWNPHADAAHSALDELRAYAEANGTAEVTAGYVSPSGRRLGKWVRDRRRDYQDGALSPQLAVELEALPGWTWGPRVNANWWEDGMAALRRYVDEHGTADPVGLYVEPGTGHRLGYWVIRRRKDFRRGKLSAAQVVDLESLPGWTWGPRDDQWRRFLGELNDFVDATGTATVPFRHANPETGYWLGSRVVVLRDQHRDGQLSPDRIAELEAIPGWTWSPRGEQWRRFLDELDRFITSNGTAMVPSDHVSPGTGYRLGAKVRDVRQRHHGGELAAERVAELEALPGWAWNMFDVSWDRFLAELKRYVDAEGTAHVPQHYVNPETGYKLGVRVSSARQRFNKGELAAERITELEALPGWTWRSRKGRKLRDPADPHSRIDRHSTSEVDTGSGSAADAQDHAQKAS